MSSKIQSHKLETDFEHKLMCELGDLVFALIDNLEF